MKFNQWTLGLAAVGVISLPSVVQAEEAANQVMTALSSTTLSGYVDTSAIWKFGTGHQLVGRSYDGAGKQDGFNLNVVKVQLEKPLSAEDNWAAGYNVGLLFGPDANTLGTSSVGAANDFAIKNAYVAVRLPVHNGLDLKLGVWDSLVGYEVFEAGNNPNYSRSFAYYIEPKQHTGLLASFRVNDVLSLSAGVANGGGLTVMTGPGWRASGRYNFGFNNTINKRSNVGSLKSYMGSVTLTAPESLGALKGATLYAGIVNTPWSAKDIAEDTGMPGVTGSPDMVNYYVGTTVPLGLEGLSLGACYDYRGSSSDKTAGIHSTWLDTVAGYISYQASEKVKLCNRLEYATGSDGAWYFNPNHAEKNELLGETFTVQYDLWANVMSRVEFRWDHDLRGDGIFNDGTDRNALSVALNVIYKF
jgi:hypothetical protein